MARLPGDGGRQHTVVLTGYSPDIRGTPGMLLLMYSFSKKSSSLERESGPFMRAHLILV